MKKILSLIGAASGIAAGNPGCADGPFVIQQSKLWQPWFSQGVQIMWQGMFTTPPTIQDKYKAVAEWSTDIAKATAQSIKQQQHFCVVGGDHASAIGTWSGVASALTAEQPLGLIWIDAHLDSHTHESSLSGNIHGMPVAALLGYGSPLLTNILTNQSKLKPENICLIGIRSYEAEELALLQKLNVKIFFMQDILKYGLAHVWQAAVEHVSRHSKFLGLTIDLDGIDPSMAPGVGTPEENGIYAYELIPLLAEFAKLKQFIGFEIAEFNPHEDKNHLTEQLAIELMVTLAKPD